MLVPVLAIGALLLLMGASGSKPRGTHGTPSEQAEAAAYCESQGGQVEMMEDVNGVLHAICIFPDDRMVEALDYYRGLAVPELPTCPAGLAFDPQTRSCVEADELPDVGPGPGPDPDPGPAPRPRPTPGPSPSDGATALAVCDQELSALWQPYASPGGNLGNNWYAWLKDLFFALAAGLMPETTGGQSFMEILEEGAGAGDPNFLRFVGADMQNPRILAEMGAMLMTGGQTCQPWLIPEPPPLSDRALSVWADIYAAAQEAVYEAVAFECPPGTRYSEASRACVQTISPSGGTATGSGGTPSGGTPSGGTPSGGTPSGGTPSGGSSERICPPNWAYNALHDKCCPDGYSYDPRADTCKPTAFLGAQRKNSRSSAGHRLATRAVSGQVPNSKKFILGAVKIPRGSIAVKRRDGTYEIRQGFAGAAFAGMGCSSGGCRAKWTPNRGQRMGNTRANSGPRTRY